MALSDSDKIRLIEDHYRSRARSCGRGSAEVSIAVTDALVAGDVVAVRVAWNGTDTGQTAHRPAARDPNQLVAIVVWELSKEGRLLRRTAFPPLAAALGRQGKKGGSS